MDATVTKVILDILMVVVIAGVGWIGMYLKQKWGVEKTADIMGHIEQAVKAAEILGAAAGWDGAAKKQWVIDQISQKFKIDPMQLSTFIEAAVQALKAAGGELIKKSVRAGGDEKIVLQSTLK